MEGAGLLIFFVLLIIAVPLISYVQRARRRESLLSKYGSEEIVERIMAKKIWQGMSVEQLVDSWGSPQDSDQTVYKTKTKETWKYGNNGKNRYRQRIYVENGYVVGWHNQ